MPTLNTQLLIDDLSQQTQDLLAMVEQWNSLPASVLNRQPQPNKWSALQCLEHLNIYGRYYLPAIEKAITHAKHTPEPTFTSGWLGNYFVESIKLPKSGTPSKPMKTLKSYNPNKLLDKQQVISEFLIQQEQLLELLEASKKVNLEKIRIPISINRLIKIRLGDCLRFVIYHNQRHFQQALKAMQ
ncbi:MAG: DinB family protein [Sphingobacteriales bacterium]|nr:DinB family protein [Sphingobacteriales bacterium]